MTTSAIRTFSELQKIQSFEGRFEYLRLKGSVGQITFGYDRYINQYFYRSREWLRTRSIVIARDNGCDLGIVEYEIRGPILIHHMNPVSIQDLKMKKAELLDPEFLICVSSRTHLAIHYSDEKLLPKLPVTRRPGDTNLWERR